jgi:hypothetical protein
MRHLARSLIGGVTALELAACADATQAPPLAPLPLPTATIRQGQAAVTASEEIVITFNGLDGAAGDECPGGAQIVPSPHVTQGYTFTNSVGGDFRAWCVGHPSYPNPVEGSDSLSALFIGPGNSTATLTKVGGGAFAMRSINLAQLYFSQAGGSPVISVTFTGTRADGRTVTQILGPHVVLETPILYRYFFNSSFANVVSVAWAQAPLHQFDNVAVGPPGPLDLDADGVPDDVDNCLAVPNPTQIDTDRDKLGDECDLVFTATMDLQPGQISLANTVLVNAVLFSSSGFDARAVMLANVHMLVNGTNTVAPATRNGIVVTSIRDYNGDGLLDRLLSFRTADLSAAGFTAVARGLMLRDNVSAAKWEAVDPQPPTVVP